MTRQQEEFAMILASNLYPVWAQNGQEAAIAKIEEWRKYPPGYVDDYLYTLLILSVKRWESEKEWRL